MKIYHEELLRIVSYDPESGHLRWRERLSNNTHVGDIVGSADGRGYRQTFIYKTKYLCHRVVWFYVYGKWPEVIDHINGNGMDNRLSNLRETDVHKNAQNRRVAKKGSKSGFLGVTPKRGRFEATIMLHGKGNYLGQFKTAEEAHAVYVAAKRQLHPLCTI